MHLRADRTTTRTALIGAGAVGLAVAGLAACGSPSGAVGSAPATQSEAASPSTTTPAPPLDLLSVDPATGSALATSTTPITLTFSSDLAADDADPEIAPATAGGWTVSGATLSFTPAAQYAPFTPLTLTIPAGLRGAGGTVLASPVTVHYTTPQPSVLRIQQLLAELDYLPLSFTPAGSTSPVVATPATTSPATSTTLPATSTTAPATPGAPATTAPTPGAPSTTAPSVASTTSSVPAAPPTTAGTLTASSISVADQAGTFAWRWPAIPAGLGVAWTQGSPDTVTTGAVMAFEADHGLAVDGEAGPAVWSALTTAVAAGQVDPRPYDYISVTETVPETLVVWQAGANVYSSLANTGVAGATTATGTYPVYERFVSTTMTGRNPDGSIYKDPDIPYVAYFHGGDAVHGFTRGSYGFPQSVGCVELPPSHAQAVYPMDYYGTLVTVS